MTGFAGLIWNESDAAWTAPTVAAATDAAGRPCRDGNAETTDGVAMSGDAVKKKGRLGSQTVRFAGTVQEKVDHGDEDAWLEACAAWGSGETVLHHSAPRS